MPTRSNPSAAKRANRAVRSVKKSLQIERADARTRTGDPFITSDGPVAAGVSSSHLRPLHIQDLADWRCLGLTRADNLVDVWWTAGRLSGDCPNSESRLSCA